MIAAGLASGISGWVSAVLGGASKAAAIRRKVGGGLLAMAVTDVIEAHWHQDRLTAA
jgi:VIT1/CCC1 family predicted Fe2+/Mn2+ transporter